MKRSEPSISQKEATEFTRDLLSGKINLDDLKDAEQFSVEELSRFRPFDELIDEAMAEFNDDVEHNSAVVEKFIVDNENHPQAFRLQMTLMQKLAKDMSDEEREALVESIVANSKSSRPVDMDYELGERIFQVLDDVRSQRPNKAIKMLENLVRRIEAKNTPHTFDECPVCSAYHPVEVALYKVLYSDNDSPLDFITTPAPYDLVYAELAERYIDRECFEEAFDAIKKALSWNPINASHWLTYARLLFDNEQYDEHYSALEMAYDRITKQDELAAYYAGLASHFDHLEKYELCVHLLRLSYQICENEMVNAIADDIVECELAGEEHRKTLDDLREEFAENCIPVGPSEIVVSCLKELCEKENAENIEECDAFSSNDLIADLEKCIADVGEI